MAPACIHWTAVSRSCVAVMTMVGALVYGAVLWSRERQTILWLARRVSKRRSVRVGTEQER